MMEVIKLANSKGMEMEVCSYGATLISLKVPNRNKDLVNVVVGLDNVKDYASPEFQKHNLYLGCTVGRYAGRISKGFFKLEGKRYTVDSENGVHLHGGSTGFDKKLWEVVSTKNSRSNNVKFGLLSKHMEGGYPGNMKVTVEYELLESNALRIVYTATTDQTTVLNLTNHAYYNLNGEGSVSEHFLQINSNKILELDDRKVPTGKILDCRQTKYDFNTKAKIKKIPSSGLDDVFIMPPKPFSAALYSEKSGICMKVLSKQPAVVIYTPIELPNLDFKDDATYSVFPAICFETQNYPDAPNNPHFPSCILRPGETYTNETVMDFKILTTN
ncbi:aldose epimerase family protein [Flagellimonas meridianipacifica]|uniref:Aldose 1-epimerase n=1 Tax=Flagellimonas meridianipacifica TaxID=1080225 RepID=A0A2T0MI80_9FLAO|nr:aldose epimerase family protein [Allomuricauda pacifica]PRX57255.1 aldose 1-epimerase [Allomuricauda pacifica]